MVCFLRDSVRPLSLAPVPVSLISTWGEYLLGLVSTIFPHGHDDCDRCVWTTSSWCSKTNSFPEQACSDGAPWRSQDHASLHGRVVNLSWSRFMPTSSGWNLGRCFKNRGSSRPDNRLLVGSLPTVPISRTCAHVRATASLAGVRHSERAFGRAHGLRGVWRGCFVTCTCCW